MSVVAVKVFENKFEMSSDSIMVHGWSSQTKDNTFKYAKMFRTKDMVVGCVGDVSESTAFSLFLKDHKLSDLRLGEEALQQLIWDFKRWLYEKTDSEEPLTNQMIIGTKFGVWLFFGISCLEITSNFAIGAGEDFARGALAMGASTKKACEVACELSAFCEYPVKTEKMNFSK